MAGVVRSIHGPIISSGDIDAHLALFAAFGLREVARCERSVAETTAIWGTDRQSCTEVTLETPGTRFGVRLVRFDPGSPARIRDPSRGSDSEALKVIDFYAPDLPAALAAIEAAGFAFKPDVADYETPEGRYQEAHLWGPDGVVCALISGDAALFDDLATVRDRLVSEPQSISGPVQDADATLAFFEEVFGLTVIHRYGLDDPSFDALVGTTARMTLRAWNVGLNKREPYFGVIDYGLPPGSQVSVRASARPPARGLLGATLIVRDAATIAAKAGVSVVTTDVPGFGPARIATVQGPNGAWFQAVQPVPVAA
ncbi:VOC family protein [Sphingomonas solaris]|uniref:VOC family protein n=1 Tax=Alterirhizorhabdus solaris TaxID=2529389 RepID=UPI00139677AD|nr:VOC family protein [Sphingomonas solaris]